MMLTQAQNEVLATILGSPMYTRRPIPAPIRKLIKLQLVTLSVNDLITLTDAGRPHAIAAAKAEAAKARAAVAMHRHQVTSALEGLMLGNWGQLDARAAELAGGLKKLARLVEEAAAIERVIARAEEKGQPHAPKEEEPTCPA